MGVSEKNQAVDASESGYNLATRCVVIDGVTRGPYKWPCI